MPFMRIEFSENLPEKRELKSFASELHKHVAQMIDTKIENFKTTFYPIPYAVHGLDQEGQGEALLFISIRLKARPEALKQQVADYIYQQAGKIFQSELVKTYIAVEILDLVTHTIGYSE